MVANVLFIENKLTVTKLKAKKIAFPGSLVFDIFLKTTKSVFRFKSFGNNRLIVFDVVKTKEKGGNRFFILIMPNFEIPMCNLLANALNGCYLK